MTAPPTVLVADDGPDRVLLHRVSLEHAGYRTCTAGTDEEVRDLLAGELPDVVLLGLRLAAAEGWALLGAMVTDERTARVPVVLVADAPWGRDHEAGRSRGATEVVTGPLGPRELSRLVRDVLDTSPADREQRRRLLRDGAALLPGPATGEG